MQVVSRVEEISSNERFVLTIGNFDGVHLGHLDLISQAKKLASDEKAKLAVMTFTPHPMMILNNASERFLLTSTEERRSLLNQAGVDYLIEINFSRDLSTLLPIEFLNAYVLSNKQIKGILLGFNFSFGAKKSGTHQVVKEILEKEAPDVVLKVALPYLQNGQPVSSSRIRQELEGGHVENAMKLLGRAHSLSGLVIKGDGRGRTIGFPTANIRIGKEYVYPKPGVYITKTNYKHMKFNSLTNIGVRPTFVDDAKLQVETHILDFNEFIYGEEITVEFFSSLRPEKKFQSVNELINQIKKDKEIAEGFWKNFKANSFWQARQD